MHHAPALLPVEPPEVDPLRFHRMVQDLEIALNEARIGQVEMHRLPELRILPHEARHRLILRLVRPDAIRGMQVQRGAQALRVQPRQEALGVGPQVGIPGVARPSGRRVAGPGDVPVHVDDAHGERHLPRAKLDHQIAQLVLAIGPEAAPPVPQRIPRQHGCTARYPAVVLQTADIVVPVAEEVEIAIFGVPGSGPLHQPALPIEYQAVRVIHQRPARARHQPWLQRNLAIDVIQRACRAAQIVTVVSAETPGDIKRLDPDR